MNPETQNQMNPDQAAAALAMATRISEGVMPKNPPPQLEEQEEMPMEGMEEPTEPVEEPVVEAEEEVEEPEESEDLSKKFDEFKGEMKGIFDTKFEELKKMLESE